MRVISGFITVSKASAFVWKSNRGYQSSQRTWGERSMLGNYCNGILHLGELNFMSNLIWRIFDTKIRSF